MRRFNVLLAGDVYHLLPLLAACSLLTAANGLCHSGNEDLVITPLILHPNTHTSNLNDIHIQIGTESLGSIT